ncbi:MAG: hypothetical protein KDA80_21165 [Planctomycetaceae bacterium]|nr:hypothetical protein [Planctomycetaceae bacterium]
MSEFKEETFTGDPVEIDGNRYENCTFENCTLVFKGGGLPALINCKINNCRWEFREGADRTIAFLRGLYHGLGDNGKQVIEQTVEAIKRPM